MLASRARWGGGLWAVAVVVLVFGTGAAGARPAGASWAEVGKGVARGINDQGQVVGSVGTRSTSHAVMWQGGVTVYLGTLKGGLTYCAALGINDRGQIVGNCSNTSGTVVHAFLWSRGRMRDLGTLGGPYSNAASINAYGVVAGSSAAGADAPPQAVIWVNGAIQGLGTLGPKYDASVALGINRHNQVVGWSGTRSGSEQAFVWRGGVMNQLPTSAGLNSAATAINGNGQIAGGVFGGGRIWPAVWSGGALAVLPTLGASGAALAIDRFGAVVGGSSRGPAVRTPRSGGTGDSSTWAKCATRPPLPRPSATAARSPGTLTWGVAARRSCSSRRACDDARRRPGRGMEPPRPSLSSRLPEKGGGPPV